VVGRRAPAAPRPGLGPALGASIAAGAITPDLAAGLGTTLAPQRGLYAIEAQASLPSGVAVRRGAIVSVERGADMRIERRTDMAPRALPAEATGAVDPH
jgi:hypothetical protein